MTTDAYRDFLTTTERPWCWCCGRDERQPLWQPWRIERAHIAAGSGTMRREEDVRAIVLLCSLCHMLHTHSAVTTQRINCVMYTSITDGMMLRLKFSRDPGNYDIEYLRGVWCGTLPDAELLPQRYRDAPMACVRA